MQRFVEIGLPVLEKKILKGFYHIYGHGGHLGHVTCIIYIHIGFIKYGFDWPSGFRENDL